MIKCPICNFESENLTTHIKTHNMTVKEFKNIFNMKYVQSDRLRLIHKNNINNNNPTKNKKHSANSIMKMSINRTGKGIGISGKYERTPEIRDRISKGVVKAHFRGDFDKVKLGIGSFIYSNKACKTIFSRSTWEARLIKVFDKFPRITNIISEPFSIPYCFNGSKHRYIPDFMVVYDDHIKSIWEVKRDDFIIGDSKTKAKLCALEKFCIANNYNMFIVDSKILTKLEKYVGNL